MYFLFFQSDQSDRPSLTAVYLSPSVNGEERELKVPGEESGQHNISASASGNAQYQITVFGENILGNGTQSSLLVCKLMNLYSIKKCKV